jgi:hypothetical protein
MDDEEEVIKEQPLITRFNGPGSYIYYRTGEWKKIMKRHGHRYHMKAWPMGPGWWNYDHMKMREIDPMKMNRNKKYKYTDRAEALQALMDLPAGDAIVYRGRFIWHVWNGWRVETSIRGEYGWDFQTKLISNRISAIAWSDGWRRERGARITKVCVVCGEEYQGKRLKGDYCSKKCEMRYRRSKHSVEQGN